MSIESRRDDEADRRRQKKNSTTRSSETESGYLRSLVRGGSYGLNHGRYYCADNNGNDQPGYIGGEDYERRCDEGPEEIVGTAQVWDHGRGHGNAPSLKL